MPEAHPEAWEMWLGFPGIQLLKTKLVVWKKKYTPAWCFYSAVLLAVQLAPTGTDVPSWELHHHLSQLGIKRHCSLTSFAQRIPQLSASLWQKEISWHLDSFHSLLASHYESDTMIGSLRNANLGKIQNSRTMKIQHIYAYT